LNTHAARKKINLFGNFGRQNLGNECTLQAIIYNIVRLLPDAEVAGICTDPKDTSARHQIAAFPISDRYSEEVVRKVHAGQGNPVVRLLRRILVGIPTELLRWAKAFKTLKSADMLVMTGTGMLGDFGISPFDLHYEILKWSIIAKLRGCKLLFVSVGAGPIDHPLSKWLVKSALSLADYRSYRDNFSKHYLESIGFEAFNDPVYPDLAFSLPRAMMPDCPNRDGQRPIIGIGLMEYYSKHCDPQSGENIYRNYVSKLSTFVTWLLKQNYDVRLFIGDVLYDKRVKNDLREAIKVQGLNDEEGQLIDESVHSLEQLFSQLAATDVVVATRFHNILLALMLNKPVVAISYHEKINFLMAGVGLAPYCQDIDHLDIVELIAQFNTLEENAESLKPQIQQKTDDYRKALDEQYSRIFNLA
jgi:polysaccharide pyruvyl transferase WcaK-like protein